MKKNCLKIMRTYLQNMQEVILPISRLTGILKQCTYEFALSYETYYIILLPLPTLYLCIISIYKN